MHARAQIHPKMRMHTWSVYLLRQIPKWGWRWHPRWPPQAPWRPLPSHWSVWPLTFTACEVPDAAMAMTRDCYLGPWWPDITEWQLVCPWSLDNYDSFSPLMYQFENVRQLTSQGQRVWDLTSDETSDLGQAKHIRWRFRRYTLILVSWKTLELWTPVLVASVASH